MTQNNPPSPEGRSAIKGGLSPTDTGTVADSPPKRGLLYEIDKLVRLANRVKKMTPTDDELADAAGILREVEVTLGDTRRRWERLTAEMPPIADDRAKRVDPYTLAGTPVARGQRFELVPQFKTVRTYNTPAILVSLSDKIEGGPTDALMEAIASGAAKLTWGWTPLKKLLRAHGVMLTISAEPVSDHDGVDAPMVGEVEVSAGTKRVPIKDTP